MISNGDFDSVFKIDTFTGELFVDAQLDRETTTDYLLNITVQDQGSPNSKAVSKLLHIIIEDVIYFAKMPSSNGSSPIT